MIQVKAIKTFVRTKSGRLKEKLVYVSKADFDKMKSGEMSTEDVMKTLRRYVKPEDGERIDGWGEAQMKQVSVQNVIPLPPNTTHIHNVQNTSHQYPVTMHI